MLTRTSSHLYFTGVEKTMFPLKRFRHMDKQTDISNYRVASLLKKFCHNNLLLCHTDGQKDTTNSLKYFIIN